MKKILITICMLFVVSAQANIEYEGKVAEPSQAEIDKSRSCFDELSKNGCPDSGEDHKEFRACLHNVFPTLTSDCQKMMTRLYGTKK